MVNSKTENQKPFEGSLRARKGKIAAEDGNWRDQKEQGSLTNCNDTYPCRLASAVSKTELCLFTLTTSTNQPPERSHVCEPVHKHALGGSLVLMDLHGPVLGKSRSPSSLSASMLSACAVVALAASALVAVAPAAAAAAPLVAVAAAVALVVAAAAPAAPPAAAAFAAAASSVAAAATREEGVWACPAVCAVAAPLLQMMCATK